MKKLESVITTTVFAVLLCCAARASAEPVPAAKREGIEWTDVWIPGANRADKPHVLLVGDSITKGYYGGVEKKLSGKAYVARLATSLCVCDPAFIPTLEAVLAQVKFDVIHFNNGLHGVGYTEEQYRAGYEQALRTVREQQPKARLVIALSTPLKPGSPKDDLNPRVDERNRIASALAARLDATVDDLHTPMKGHAEYYRDPYHYLGPAITLQVEKVAAALSDVLK